MLSGMTLQYIYLKWNDNQKKFPLTCCHSQCYKEDGTSKNPDCPVCSKSLNKLAQPLPMAHCANSRLVCKISGEVMNENNPPMMLPNGYVYGYNVSTLQTNTQAVARASMTKAVHTWWLWVGFGSNWSSVFIVNGLNHTQTQVFRTGYWHFQKFETCDWTRWSSMSETKSAEEKWQLLTVVVRKQVLKPGLFPHLVITGFLQVIDMHEIDFVQIKTLNCIKIIQFNVQETIKN